MVVLDQSRASRLDSERIPRLPWRLVAFERAASRRRGFSPPPRIPLAGADAPGPQRRERGAVSASGNPESPGVPDSPDSPDRPDGPESPTWTRHDTGTRNDAHVMANLNFQQAPRSLGGGGVGVGGRTGGSSVGGAGFGGSGGVVAAPPPTLPPSSAQLLPNRTTTLFNQRTFPDRRSLVSSMMPSSNPMAVRGTLSGSVMGRADSDGAPPLLDPSEFPSLTARGHGEQPTHHVPPPGSKPYVGMVKQPTAEQNEFTMSSEDFPALPGTSGGNSNSGGSGGTIGSGLGSSVSESSSNPAAVPPAPTPVIPPPPPSDLSSIDKSRQGVQTSPDGKVTNIPPSMVPNQYGIIGLLTFIRASESEPELVSLALGQDLTTLGLNLNSHDNLYLTFAGPWSDMPCRPQDIDYHVPPEYLINASIREKLSPLRMNKYKDDLLFYLFYCFVGDTLQVAAASELYNREWRYHIEEKVWITQAPGLASQEKTNTYERGTYYYFDAHSWRKVAKEFHLDYSKLEGRPQLPPHFSPLFHA